MNNDAKTLSLGLGICLAAWKRDPPGPDETVEEVAKRAFRLVRDDANTWFTDNDDVRFRIGVGVLLTHYKDTPTGDLLKNTLDGLKALNALVSGVPVDLTQMAAEAKETLPLLPWFQDTAPSL
jgi:hypothetical protein